MDERVDAAEVGLALAFPGGLRRQVAALVASWGPVEAAVAAGWAGLDRLRLVTAEVNGSLASPRVLGRGRAAGAGPGLIDGGFGGDGVGRAAASGIAGGDVARVDGPALGTADVGGGAAAPGAVVVMDVVTGPEASAAPAVANSGGSGGVSDRESTGRDSSEAPRALAPVAVVVSRASSSATPLSGGADEAWVFEGAATAPVNGGEAQGGGRFRADVQAALQGSGGLRAASVLDRGADGGGAAADLVVLPSFEPASVRDSGMRRSDGQGAAPTGLTNDGPDSVVARSVLAPSVSAERDGAGDAGDGVSGTITLDGHLVGHWMSDRMARDASRPGAGTTFFDPRQSPAWTPSGAL